MPSAWLLLAEENSQDQPPVLLLHRQCYGQKTRICGIPGCCFAVFNSDISKAAAPVTHEGRPGGASPSAR